MLPETLQRPFTADEARGLDVNRRALGRLLRAGLCRRCEDGRFELLSSVDEMQLALTGLGPAAALSCDSVAVLLDWPLPEAPELLHLTVPRTNSRPRWPGAVVHSRRLDENETCEFRGMRLTIPLVAALDLASTLPLKAAVVLLDAALRKGNLTVKGLRKRLVERRRAPGMTHAARAVRLSSRARQSPLESEFRVLVHEAGLPAPDDQVEVRDAGTFLARVDFAWTQYRLVVEIDGYEFHREYDVFVQDRRRQNALVLAGWRVLRFSASDLRSRPEKVVAEVRRALGA